MLHFSSPTTPPRPGLRRRILATAILDRLLRHCGGISIDGLSYRLKDRLQPSNEKNEVA
ncbi:ATP-binding protein [Streptomyces sp. NPDC002232]|uniref:ATP-binding protein n=1 Tax=Streptomyces sp. NPDC002232 TaxID=3364640 RepID=UPI0036746E61